MKDAHSSISEMNFVSNLPGLSSASDVCPSNSSLSSVSRTSSSRTISPKYMPLIIFSKLREKTSTWINRILKMSKGLSAWFQILLPPSGQELINAALSFSEKNYLLQSVYMWNKITTSYKHWFTNDQQFIICKHMKLEVCMCCFLKNTEHLLFLLQMTVLCVHSMYISNLKKQNFF